MNLTIWNTLAWAAQGATGTPTTSATGGLPPMVLMFGAIILMFYFLILRPQKAEQRKRDQLLNSIAKGDAVITSGGIMGTVESVDPAKGIVTVTVAPKLNLRFTRAAITSVTKKKDAKESDSGEAETTVIK